MKTKLIAAERTLAFDGGVLRLVGEDRLFVCNASAHQILSALEAGWSKDALASEIGAAHGLDPRAVRRDVDSIAARWAAEEEKARSHAHRLDAIRPPTGRPEGWAARWTCRIRGRLFEFAVEDEGLAGGLRSLLHHLEIEPQAAELLVEVREAGEGKSVIFVDGVERARVFAGIGLRDTVHSTLAKAIWPGRPVLAMVHGGAVALDGKGLCFPAFAGSGKTTLIAHLMGRGFDYLSDDMTPIDETGAILPWPMPLSVKTDSWPVLAALYPDLASGRRIETMKGPAALLMPPDGAWDAPPTPVSALIFPLYGRESTAGLAELRPFAALEHLVSAGIWIGHPIVEERVAVLLAWLERVPAFALTYGDLDQAENEVRKILRHV